MVNKSFIQQYFNYYSHVLGCSVATLSNKLQRLQNRAVRIITRQGYNVRSKDQLKSIGFKILHQQRLQQLCIMMYKAGKKLVPSYLSETFTNINQIHDHNTRQCQFNFALPKPKTNFMKKSFGYRGTLVLSNLSSEIKNSNSIDILKGRSSYNLIFNFLFLCH